MVTQHKPVISSEIMSGWKDIANYLGKGVRTLQRYEREGALPVKGKPNRFLGQSGGSDRHQSRQLKAQSRLPRRPKTFVVIAKSFFSSPRNSVAVQPMSVP